MFQRNRTIHPDAARIIGNAKSIDQTAHPLNTLGSKTFSGHAFNPLGPQRRVVVTKKLPPSDK